MLKERVAFCEPLVPLTVKLNGLGVDAVRLLTVSVLLWPAKMGEALKAHVAPEEQERVTLPVKPLGADAETVKVADVLPIITVVVGLAAESENTASPFPERATV